MTDTEHTLRPSRCPDANCRARVFPTPDHVSHAKRCRLRWSADEIHEYHTGEKMGYASYTLDDGREGGYAITATCDDPDCNEQIDRGMAYVCGDVRAGVNGGERGCGNYFCADHLLFSIYAPTQVCRGCEERYIEEARCAECSGEDTGPAEGESCEHCEGGFVPLDRDAA